MKVKPWTFIFKSWETFSFSLTNSGHSIQKRWVQLGDSLEPLALIQDRLQPPLGPRWTAVVTRILIATLHTFSFSSRIDLMRGLCFVDFYLYSSAHSRHSVNACLLKTPASIKTKAYRISLAPLHVDSNRINSAPF